MKFLPENLELRFLSFRGEHRKRKNTECIKKCLLFRDINPIPYSGAEGCWRQVDGAMKFLPENFLKYLTDVVIFSKGQSKGGDNHRRFVNKVVLDKLKAK